MSKYILEGWAETKLREENGGRDFVVSLGISKCLTGVLHLLQGSTVNLELKGQR